MREHWYTAILVAFVLTIGVLLCLTQCIRSSVLRQYTIQRIL
jgi:hypothetical protein